MTQKQDTAGERETAQRLYDEARDSFGAETAGEAFEALRHWCDDPEWPQAYSPKSMRKIIRELLAAMAHQPPEPAAAQERETLAASSEPKSEQATNDSPAPVAAAPTCICSQSSVPPHPNCPVHGYRIGAPLTLAHQVAPLDGAATTLQERGIKYAESAGYRLDESNYHRVFYAYCAGFTDAQKAAELAQPHQGSAHPAPALPEAARGPER